MVQREIQSDLDWEQIEFVIGALAKLEINSTLVEKIRATQLVDDWCKLKVWRVYYGFKIDFQVDDSVLKFKGKLCIPLVEKLRLKILS